MNRIEQIRAECAAEAAEREARFAIASTIIGHVHESKPKAPAKIAPVGLSEKDQFAELLSQGLTVNEAGDQLGFTRGKSNGMLHRMRLALGPQAI